MIQSINSNNWSKTINSINSAKQVASEASLSSSETTATEPTAKTDAVQLSIKKEVPVTYANISNSKNPAMKDIAALKAEADKATENLRKLVEELILKQNKNYKVATDSSSTEETDSIEQAQAAISEDGQFGINAVSDRLVDFAIAVSNGDKTKLEELTSAIDKGFAAAKDALGGTLPDICEKTYNSTMKKLDDWANGSEIE